MVFIKNGKKWQHVLSVVVLESVDCILGFRAEVSVAEVSDAGQHVELLVDLGVHGRGHDLHVGKCVGDGVDTCSIYQTFSKEIELQTKVRKDFTIKKKVLGLSLG